MILQSPADREFINDLEKEAERLIQLMKDEDRRNKMLQDRRANDQSFSVRNVIGRADVARDVAAATAAQIAAGRAATAASSSLPSVSSCNSGGAAGPPPRLSATNKAQLATALAIVVAELAVQAVPLIGDVRAGKLTSGAAAAVLVKRLIAALIRTGISVAVVKVVEHALNAAVHKISAELLALRSSQALVVEGVEEWLKSSSPLTNAVGGIAGGAVATALFECVRLAYWSIAPRRGLADENEATAAIQEIVSWENVVKHAISLIASAGVATVTAPGWFSVLAAVLVSALATHVVTKVFECRKRKGSWWAMFRSWFAVSEDKLVWVRQDGADVEIPHFLRCPISNDLLVDPVFSPAYHLYSRPLLWEWIYEKGTDPLTREQLSMDRYRPSREMKDIVRRFAERFELELVPADQILG
ncbi:hypothetical protein DFJ73DRAFT_793741 [Zopfochytrium polystomum]|nr:hypothetical protein DFJ73DRAFT_793741 [Zopfochytrium polystomum]